MLCFLFSVLAVKVRVGLCVCVSETVWVYLSASVKRDYDNLWGLEVAGKPF